MSEKNLKWMLVYFLVSMIALASALWFALSTSRAAVERPAAVQIAESAATAEMWKAKAMEAEAEKAKYEAEARANAQPIRIISPFAVQNSR